MEASLLKWEWYLQERVKPYVKGLFKSQENAASLILSPLPTDIEVQLMAPPSLAFLTVLGAPLDQLLEREWLFFSDGIATIVCKAALWKATVSHPVSSILLVEHTLLAQLSWQDRGQSAWLYNRL